MELLALVGALLIGLSLGVLGAGGSIVTTPLLIYVVGEPVRLAIAESLLIVGLVSSYGSWLQYRQNNLCFTQSLRFLPACVLGTITGSQLATLFSAETQLFAFALVAAVSAYFMISPKAYKAGNASMHRIFLYGLPIGCVAGFVGVGGGFLIVPALVILLNMKTQSAVSTSMFIIAVMSLFGFSSYQYRFYQTDIHIDWQLIIVVTAFGLAGVQLGCHLNKRINHTHIKCLFGICLAVSSIMILVNTIRA